MSFLQPTVKTSVTLGKTDEFGFTSSEFDSAIPVVVGTQRLSGNIIWGSQIREEVVVDVQESGGSDGPKQESTTTTYFYYIDLAVLFAKGEAQSLNRIWADGKIIYDATGTTIDQMDRLVFSTYLGTSDQTPNSTIEDDVGEDSTPAYRDLVYLVFEDLPLVNFGNRIPALTAEWVFGDQETSITTNIVTTDLNNNGTSDNSIDYEAMIWRTDADIVYYEDDFGGSTGVVRATVDGSNATITDPVQILTGSTARNIRAVSPSGAVFIQEGEDSSIAETWSINSTVYNVAMRVFDRQAALLGGSESIVFVNGSASIGASEQELIVNDSSTWVESDSNDNLDSRIDSLDTTSFLSERGMVVTGDTGEAWCTLIDTSGNIRIYRGDSSGITLVETITPSDIDASETGVTNMWTAYDPARDGLLIAVEGTVNDYILFHWTTTEGIRWANLEMPFNPDVDSVQNAQGAILTGTAFVHANVRGAIVRVTLSNGELDANFDGQTQFLTGFQENVTLTWDEPNGILWTRSADDLFGLDQWVAVVVNAGAGADIGPQEIIETIAEEAGIDTSNLELTNLSTTTNGLKSYVYDARDTAANLLQPLLTVLQIDVADTDDKVEFVQRGLKSLSFTIEEDDMIPTGDNEGEPYVRARIKAENIPRRLEIAYSASESQYQDGIQSDERSTSATTARGTETQDYPGAMTADGARQRAQALLYELWSQQERLTTRLPWSYMTINPTDVGTVNLNNGDSLRVRCTKASLGADLTIEFECVIEEVGINESEVTGSTGDSNIVTSPANVEDSDVFIFDTPLLRDTDEPSTTGQLPYYWGASGEDVWRGAFLYLQTTDTLIETLGKQINAIPFGVIDTAPPDATQFFRFEEDQSMIVDITRGEELFGSLEEIDVLNGGNVLLVVKANGEVEYLQFQDVEVDDNDSQLLTLSRLLRGRRGTDTMANGLAAGDAVYLMISANYVNGFDRDLSTVDTAYTYRGVTIGQIFEEGEEFDFTSEGRPLMPYAPTKIEVTQSGGAGTDLVFTWQRRTRIGGEDDLSTTATDIPLSEDSEAYEIVFYTDDTYATEVDDSGYANSTDVTSETYTLDATDADALGSTIYYRIFQVSAQVGRGFASNESTPRDL